MTAETVEYVDRWQFDRDHRDLCVCDTCGLPVAPISAGWAHEFSTSDAYVTHDFRTTAHQATVRGHHQ